MTKRKGTWLRIEQLEDRLVPAVLNLSAIEFRTIDGTDNNLVVLNPVLNWYVAHAWIYDANPSGVMSNWNPAVTCP